ncbi:MAG: hypothetical protein KGQ59_05010 [Bdellovibrionales bacterium]|nr:hypothetical protein [Bdellovibrionales bacterium]
MKTLTEFSAFNLRDAHRKAQEIKTSIQTEESQKEALSAYLAERFKLDGDKIGLFLASLDLALSKPQELENLKRIIVYSLAEGEKTPSNVVQRDSHAYSAEYLPSLRPKQHDRRAAGSKHAKGKGKGRGKRRGDLKGKRPDGTDERRGATGATREGSAPPSDGRREPRRDRKNRAPRPPRKDLPPGHVSVEQAARHAVKSTGIRPVERPQPTLDSAKATPETGN